MATLILSTVGSQLFGPIGGFIGAMAGSRIDGVISSELGGYKKQPSRLAGLKLQTSLDGAPMPIIYGKMRISGQLIWAAKFKETLVKRRAKSAAKLGKKSKNFITA
ncbi:MAG: phage host specificity protein [Hyphomonadaceae bacterium]|nr:MAG: phage host specificity protein [Hyphomonadaceae bacterium]KAF0183863.1 MAG: phage host specificity protein [Hyphomonadaceae bacterium]